MSVAQPQIEQLEGADRIWHLRQTPLMDGLPLSDLNAVASACTDRVYSRGEVIFSPGDPADDLFVLNRGCVRISVPTDEDREKILSILSNGDVFGESALESRTSHRVKAVAHQDCWVSLISSAQIVRLIEQRLSIALNCMKILNRRLQEAREEVEAHSFLDTEHRVAKTLLKLARAHGKAIHGDHHNLKLKIFLSHELLARLIGGNRPHVSMIMSRFKKKGWINYRGRKLLINTHKMKEFLTLKGNGSRTC